MADIKLRGVVKRFGNVEVIHGVDLDIKHREFAVFVGPSGCGKSTLLRLVAGLEDITEGDLSIEGERVNDLPPARRGIAMVFQSYALYPHMSVYENMAFGLKLAKTPKDEIDRRVREAADILQIGPLLERKPKELSGGQRQRVAIGRAIVREPKVFLFDEPLSNLDAKLRVQTRIELAKLHGDLDATMIYVTHDQVEAMTLADKIIVLRDGYVEQVGSPLDLYRHPDNLFVAGFIGSPAMNFVETNVAAVNNGQADIALPGGGTISVPCDPHALNSGDKVTFGTRPEHMSERGTGDSTIPGEIFVVERLGGESYLYIRVEGSNEMMVVKAHGESDAKQGDTIKIGVAARASHLFNADGRAVSRTEGVPEAA